MEDMSAEDRREAAADRFFAFVGRSTAAFLVRLGESVGRNVSERSGAYGRQLCFLQATMFLGRGCPGDNESAGVSHRHLRRRAVALCGGFPIKLATPQRGPKEAFSRSCIAARYLSFSSKPMPSSASAILLLEVPMRGVISQICNLNHAL
jgi:hypothetical protein